MTSFSQRNPKWANAKMGRSQLTIGRFGCTTSCQADLSTYFGDNLNPLQVSKHIRYTPGGLVIWQSCVFPSFQFWFREQGRNDTNIRNALADPNLAVILQVSGGKHWVVATGLNPGGGYKIADPWNGDFSTTARYGQSITGAAYFKRK